MLVLESENQFNELVKSDELVLVDFYADWCMPCRMLTPTLEKISDKIKVIKINTDNFRAIAEKYEINSIPTLMFFKNGQQVGKLVGLKKESEIIEYSQTLQ